MQTNDTPKPRKRYAFETGDRRRKTPWTKERAFTRTNTTGVRLTLFEVISHTITTSPSGRCAGQERHTFVLRDKLNNDTLVQAVARHNAPWLKNLDPSPLYIYARLNRNDKRYLPVIEAGENAL